MPHSCSPHRLVGGPIPTRCVVVPRQCQSPTVSVPSGSPHSIGGRAGAKPLWGRPHVAASEPPLTPRIVGRLQTQRTQRPASTKRDGCNGWVRCEGKRTRALGLGPTRFWPTPMLASAPRSRLILCYPVNHQHVLSKHVCCHHRGPVCRYVGVVVLPRRGTNRILGCQYLGHSARRRAPCAICSVFIDIYVFCGGFPVVCPGDRMLWLPRNRGVSSSPSRLAHAPHMSVRLLPQSPAPRRRARPISPRSASWPAPPRICRRSWPRSRRPT